MSLGLNPNFQSPDGTHTRPAVVNTHDRSHPGLASHPVSSAASSPHPAGHGGPVSNPASSAASSIHSRDHTGTAVNPISDASPAAAIPSHVRDHPKPSAPPPVADASHRRGRTSQSNPAQGAPPPAVVNTHGRGHPEPSVNITSSAPSSTAVTTHDRSHAGGTTPPGTFTAAGTATHSSNGITVTEGASHANGSNITAPSAKDRRRRGASAQPNGILSRQANQSRTHANNPTGSTPDPNAMAKFEGGESLDSVLADVRRVFKQDGLNGKSIKSAREVLEASKQTLDNSKADTKGLNAAFDKLKKDFDQFVANKNSGGNVDDSKTNEMSTSMDTTISSAKAEIQMLQEVLVDLAGILDLTCTVSMEREAELKKEIDKMISEMKAMDTSLVE